MKTILLSLALISLLLIQTSCQQSPSFIIELCRHGARGPSDTLFDPNWPKWAYSNLTPQGMRQQYLLGKLMKKNYPGIFSQISSDYWNIMSDGGNRTTMSALSQIYGIMQGEGPGFLSNYTPSIAEPPFASNYTSSYVQQLNNTFATPNGYYPIDVGFAEGSDAEVINPTLACKNLKYWEINSIFSPQAFDVWGNFTDLINYLDQYNFPISINNPLAVIGLYDTVEANVIQGRPLPGMMPFTQAMYQNMTMLTTWYAVFGLFGSDLKAWSTATFMVRRLLEVIQDKISNPNSINFILYSGHDLDLLCLLAAFKVVNLECALENYVNYWLYPDVYNPSCIYPVYASSVVLEVYNAYTSPTVRFVYNNRSIVLCEGQEYCPWSQFQKFALNSIGNWTVQDAEESCNGQLPPETESKINMFKNVSQNLETKDYLIIGLVSISFMLAHMVFKMKKREKKIMNLGFERNYYQMSS